MKKRYKKMNKKNRKKKKKKTNKKTMTTKVMMVLTVVTMFLLLQPLSQLLTVLGCEEDFPFYLLSSERTNGGKRTYLCSVTFEKENHLVSTARGATSEKWVTHENQWHMSCLEKVMVTPKVLLLL